MSETYNQDEKQVAPATASLQASGAFSGLSQCERVMTSEENCLCLASLLI